MKELVIIGAGPAGMAAAVYAARQKLDFVVLSKNIGGQTLLSSEVENYLGFHFVSGAKLVEKFQEHIRDYDFELCEDEEVKEIKRQKTGFLVRTAKKEYETKTVLVATGAQPRKLNVSGEDAFYGKGVTYCATCDAPLYSKKDVAVVGGGNSAMEAALFAVKYSNKVYMINREKEISGERALVERVKAEKKITIINSASTKTVLGGKFVTGIKIDAGEKEKIIKVQGVFIEIGMIPTSKFISTLVEVNKTGEIVIDKHNETSVKGIFAAGDVTDVCQKQIIVAAGEGAKACLHAIKSVQKSR